MIEHKTITFTFPSGRVETIECSPARQLSKPKVVRPPVSAPLKLGDWTEVLLQRIGVTPERWGEVRELFGWPPGCGGCQARKDYLNRVSEWWRGEAS